MPMRKITRRGLIRASFSTSTVLLGGCAVRMMPAMSPGSMQDGSTVGHLDQAHPGRGPSSSFVPDVDIALRATQAEVPLISGKPTLVWRYEGQLLKGESNAVTMLDDTSVGPIIRVRTGQKVRVRFTNSLPEPDALSVIHWHGLHLPEDMDGHPRSAIAPGSTYVYEFEVRDRAGTYWFHPHPHGDTARQVMRGLAGLFIVSDDEERALGLPAGEFDVPLVVQDRTFDSANQLLYLGMGMMSGPMNQMMGFLGDRITVNGKPKSAMVFANRPYRLRVLNGSNSRIFKLAWSDATPLTVIATDGGLLEKPLQRSYVMLAPGERIELFADFTNRNIGDALQLVSLAFEGTENVPVPAAMMSRMNGMSQMDMRGDALPIGSAFDILNATFSPTKSSSAPYQLPPALGVLPRPTPSAATNAAQPRRFEIDHRSMTWRFNGKQWEGDVSAANEQVKINTSEVWEFINNLNLGEAMDPMGMAHPIHIHGLHFQILERALLIPELQLAYNTVRDGFVDSGLKDTFLLMPGERVRVLLSFKDFTGKFVYHCHNLEHEDQGLMRNYQVT